MHCVDLGESFLTSIYLQNSTSIQPRTAAAENEACKVCPLSAYRFPRSITGQKAFQWDKSIRSAPNPGDSWCICMWAFARMIERVGCENVHLHCESTDLAFVLDRYHDGGHRLDKAHECLKKTCPMQSGGSAADGIEVVASGVEVLTDREGEGEL